ncbi:hypothetical protein PISMIDRAFT_679618 [Pisolithus microcarpus 441]|uniref:Uncharacterized protein n=1 Tax=Pisolithus microcarpus 441 TaxID=765257 RepID=A0A0C9Z1Y6_9AGAM|nr:hypothetical protein PISMIDRAFT_679618 [Pisolithus microcarpus 441]
MHGEPYEDEFLPYPFEAKYEDAVPQQSEFQVDRRGDGGKNSLEVNQHRYMAYTDTVQIDYAGVVAGLPCSWPC